MQKMVLAVVCGTFAAVAVFCLALPAKADKAFRDEFIAKYVQTTSKDAKDVAFARACEEAKCTICHEGLNKKKRNAYGQELAKLLKRDTDKENKAKIQAALDKVAALKANPKNPNSPTFGDLIKAGKLPGGTPKAKSGEVSENE
jgi:hypothetical protein